jgi:hypothetical protein
MVTRYVNTASTAGGNGTTNGTIGDTRAYATLGGASVALASSNFDDDLEILCCGSVADGGVAAFNGATYVTAGHTIYVKTNASDVGGPHGGKWNNSTYRLVNSSTWVFQTDSNTAITVEGLQMFHTGTTNGLSSAAIKKVEFKNCIVKASSINVAQALLSTFGGSGSDTIYFTNCAFVCYGVRPGYLFYLTLNTKFYNCIMCGGTAGVTVTSGTTVVKNCGVFDNTDDFTGSLTVDHCASDDGDGTNPIAVASWAAQFINPNYISEVDFRLKPSCTLSNAGVGPASDAVVPTTSMGSAYRYGATTDVGPFSHSSFKQKSSAQGFGMQGVR